MPRVSQKSVPAKHEAIKARIAAGKGRPQREFRVVGHDGLVLIVRPSGTGGFYLFYRPEFGRKQRKLRLGDFPAVTLAEAVSLAADARAAVEKGGDPAATRQAEKHAITFQQLAERFLAGGGKAATTCEAYRWTLAKDVFPAIGRKPAAKVTADDVQAICDTIKARGAGVQAQRTKSAIGGVYRWGIAQRLVKANPAREVANQQAFASKRDRVPTDTEIAALWNAVADSGDAPIGAIGIIIRLGILTGQRRKEIAGARVSELHGLGEGFSGEAFSGEAFRDGGNPTWIIPATTTKAGKLVAEGRMKNKREQRVFLSRQAAELFRTALQSAGGVHVFPARQQAGRKPHIHGESVSRAVARLRQAHGIEDLTFHDLRRAIATFLGNRDDVPDRVIGMVLHHTPSGVTERHYDLARREDQLRRAWQAWADHVEGLTRVAST